MRARSLKLGAIGASIGLVLLASAISPASAARPSGPVQTATSITSCSSFKGLTATGSNVVANGIPMKAGDTITSTVTPARSGDLFNVQVAATTVTTTLYEAPTTTPYTYRVPKDGTYYFGWSLDTSANGGPPSTITWSFTATCSTTAVSPSPTPTPTATTKPGKGRGK